MLSIEGGQCERRVHRGTGIGGFYNGMAIEVRGEVYLGGGMQSGEQLISSRFYRLVGKAGGVQGVELQSMLRPREGA